VVEKRILEADGRSRIFFRKKSFYINFYSKKTGKKTANRSIEMKLPAYNIIVFEKIIVEMCLIPISPRLTSDEDQGKTFQ
jgi:hypothetical protein